MSQFFAYFSNLTEFSVFGILSEFRILDVVDILLLTVLIYRLILLIQGTRTMYILYGMFFIVAGAVIASEMQLLGVKLLVDNFLNSIVIIIVVLFQSDFRNAFARLGRRQFSYDLSLNMEELYLIFEKSIQQLSAGKVGALFVFERNMDIKNMQHGGIEMNSIPSVPLILSIFDKNVPVHDGAMIINQKKQIKMVGSILPLTISLEKRVEYGTRHRAAIGISEETDAISVVVSEQTGKISYAQSGSIHTIELDRLKPILLKLVK